MTDFLESELPENEARLDNEWLLVSAIREGLSIGRRRALPYREAVQYAIQLAPELISADSLIAPGFESELPTFYRAKAAAQTRVSNQAITPFELASADLRDLESIRSGASERERPVLDSRMAELRRVLEELSVSTWTETQAILHDRESPPSVEGVRLPVTGRGQGYTEFEMPTGRMLRTRVFHPDPPEWRSGVDLIYENYWVRRSTLFVRIAALQYKRWDGNAIYLSQDPRIATQMDRAIATFCDSGFCKPSSDKAGYRLPHCSAFLRPTDRVQRKRGWQATKGWHVPICAAKRALAHTRAATGIIRREAIRNSSVTQGVFEVLFGREMIGSDWLEARVLEQLYDRLGVLIDIEQPVVHVQEYSEGYLRSLEDREIAS
jgi:hypothetical protein